MQCWYGWRRREDLYTTECGLIVMRFQICLHKNPATSHTNWVISDSLNITHTPSTTAHKYIFSRDVTNKKTFKYLPTSFELHSVFINGKVKIFLAFISLYDMRRNKFVFIKFYSSVAKVSKTLFECHCIEYYTAPICFWNMTFDTKFICIQNN